MQKMASAKCNGMRFNFNVLLNLCNFFININFFLTIQGIGIEEKIMHLIWFGYLFGIMESGNSVINFFDIFLYFPR